MRDWQDCGEVDFLAQGEGLDVGGVVGEEGASAEEEVAFLWGGGLVSMCVCV